MINNMIPPDVLFQQIDMQEIEMKKQNGAQNHKKRNMRKQASGAELQELLRRGPSLANPSIKRLRTLLIAAALLVSITGVIAVIIFAANKLLSDISEGTADFFLHRRAVIYVQSAYLHCLKGRVAQ
jgi:hypothetical protein